MRIALLGDIAIFGRYCLSRDKKLLNYFDEIKEHLSSFDIVIGNLEAPFAIDERPIGGKSATVKSHPDNVELLNHIGITHLNLANNHIGDFGKTGYHRTIELIEKNGIGWFGTEEKQLKIEKNSEKIALLGFCSYNTNPSFLKTKSTKGLNYLDAEYVYKKIQENSSQGYFSILSVHSGQEHIHFPSSEDVKFARLLAHDFNYVYYGHHPHVIQGYERLNGSAIFYSLGNFIFDDVYTPRDLNKPLIALSEANKTGLIAELEIKEGHLSDCTLTHIYMGKNQMLVGHEVSKDDQEEYNSYLSDAGSDQYDMKRSAQISKYISKRKEMRDLTWYLKRLNFNSVGILIKARKNSKLYRKHFLSRIGSFENNQ
tara:strand:- start:26 stop:1135 length:1110 start_codon:yes stop_codon:yes gene_type:complete